MRLCVVSKSPCTSCTAVKCLERATTLAAAAPYVDANEPSRGFAGIEVALNFIRLMLLLALCFALVVCSKRYCDELSVFSFQEFPQSFRINFLVNWSSFIDALGSEQLNCTVATSHTGESGK